jgi:hypothetical protein
LDVRPVVTATPEMMDLLTTLLSMKNGLADQKKIPTGGQGKKIINKQPLETKGGLSGLDTICARAHPYMYIYIIYIYISLTANI